MSIFDATRSILLGATVVALVSTAFGTNARSAGPDGPAPSVGGRALTRFSDFRNNVWSEIFVNRWQPPSKSWTPLGYQGTPWVDGSGIFEVPTRHGPGFRFVQNERVPRGSGRGVQIADVDNLVDRELYLGTVTSVSGMMMFPRAGNPKGFPAFGDWNVLWEWTQGTAVYNGFGVDSLAPGGPRIYVSSFNPSDPARNRKVRASSVLKYDRWYDWRWQIKWSTGSDGFVNFWLGARRVASMTGATVAPWSAAPWLQWGWYGGDAAGRNEVVYARLRKT